VGPSLVTSYKQTTITNLVNLVFGYVRISEQTPENHVFEEIGLCALFSILGSIVDIKWGPL
jgi:hypothetical protein